MKIYCHETKFLDSDEYPEGIEKDKYDDHSFHFAALDSDNNVVGTLRLILDSEHGFPLEEHSVPDMTGRKFIFQEGKLAEISRLTVSRSWRRRKNDGLYGYDILSFHT